MPAPAALISLFYSAWQPNCHFVLLFPRPGDWRWGWRLPSREPSCRHCQSQSLPSSFLIPQSTIQHHNRGQHCTVCLRVYSMCLLYCTYEQPHQHQRQGDPIAIRRDAIRYDALPAAVCATRRWGADPPRARVKHQEQAAVTAMTVSDEVDSCGRTSRALLAGLAGLAGWSGPARQARVVDNGWLRCCDDRCRPSTATSKRHPNPADQCKSILNPRLESSCCHNATVLLPERPCRAAAFLCRAALVSHAHFLALPIHSSTPH